MSTQPDLWTSIVEDASDDTDRAVIDQGITVIGKQLRWFSANDLRPLLPAVRPALIGARFLAAAKRGDIRRIGYITSTDPGTHGRPIGEWLWVGAR